MAKLAEVITFPGGNAGNISAMLRQAADTIDRETEADDRTESIVAVSLSENGTVAVYGWGRTDNIRAMGTLHLALADLARREGE